MHTTAVVIEEPKRLSLRTVALTEPAEADVVVAVEWSGISTGTERLLYSGSMPPFPGLGYPLVPGYEAVGRIISAGVSSGRSVGQRVFVAGARCFDGVRSLFGSNAARLIVPGAKALVLDDKVAMDGALLALAATARHAAWQPGATPPDLIVGHGALGRLLARLSVALGGDREPPTVWEVDPARRAADGYRVIHPDEDNRRDYRAIYDVSGNAGLLNTFIERLAPGGEVVLAGFYGSLTFNFVPAFLREARIRVAAEWRAEDLQAVVDMANAGTLHLGGIITHRSQAADACSAYPVAFSDPQCIKMVLDWRDAA